MNGLRVCRRALVWAWLAAAAALAHGQTGPVAELAEQAYGKIIEGRGSARAERYADALRQLGEAVSLAQRAGSGLPLALALHNRAEVRLLNGDPANALSDYYRVLGLYTELGHPSGVRLAQARIDIASQLVRKPLAPAGPRPPQSAAPGAPFPAPPATSPKTEATNRLALIDEALERVRRRHRGEAAPHTPPVEGVRVTHATPREALDDPQARAYVESLRRKVGANARYPEYARRTRQEGAADVVVSVRANGEIESVELSRSSGFIVLDVEALRNVRESAPFGPVPDGVAERPLSVRLTLDYRLPDAAADVP